MGTIRIDGSGLRSLVEKCVMTALNEISGGNAKRIDYRSFDRTGDGWVEPYTEIGADGTIYGGVE